MRITPDLLGLERAHVLERSDVGAEAEALIPLAIELLGQAESTIVRPGELADELRVRLFSASKRAIPLTNRHTHHHTSS